MENLVILGILAVIAAGVIAVLVKRSGRKGCCGSSDYKPRKKKLKQVIATKVFTVEGMHCEKCSNRVMEVVNDIPGVAGVVNLKQGVVTVSYEQEVPDAQIKANIERVGYHVTDIQ